MIKCKELEFLSVKELKKLAKELGISTKGRKKELCVAINHELFREDPGHLEPKQLKIPDPKKLQTLALRAKQFNIDLRELLEKEIKRLKKMSKMSPTERILNFETPRLKPFKRLGYYTYKSYYEGEPRDLIGKLYIFTPINAGYFGGVGGEIYNYHQMSDLELENAIYNRLIWWINSGKKTRILDDPEFKIFKKMGFQTFERFNSIHVMDPNNVLVGTISSRLPPAQIKDQLKTLIGSQRILL